MYPYKERKTTRIALSSLFPSPALPGSGSKGIISVRQDTPKVGIKVKQLNINIQIIYQLIIKMNDCEKQ